MIPVTWRCGIEYGSAERRLMAAVLLDALRALRTGTRHGVRLEAFAWVMDDFGDAPFGFVFICQVLGLDQVSLRHWAVTAYGESRPYERTTGRKSRLQARRMVPGVAVAGVDVTRFPVTIAASTG